MNKSSSVLSQDYKNTSSFFNQSSESVIRCCDFRPKYEDCYRQLSHTRIECRNLKQENTVLRNTLRGTEEENAVLKGLLTTKKEMIGRLNREAVVSNQEISRLQDQIHALNLELHRQQDMNNQMKGKESSLRQELKSSIERCNKLKRDNQRLQADYEHISTQIMNSKQQNMKQVQKICQQKDSAINQTQLFFLKKLEEIGTASSPSKTSKNGFTFSKTYNNPSSSIVMYNLQLGLTSLKQRHQQNQNKHDQIINTKQAQISQLQQKVTDLQSQMSESMQLFQQQISQTQQLKKALAHQQQQVEAHQANKCKHAEREQLFLALAKRIATMLKNTLIQNTDILDRLLTALPTGKKFELQVLMKEAEASCDSHCKNTLRNVITSKHFEQTNRALDELRQDYELLQLKHATLQRQYDEILEDNQRLIKYNHLSRYRLIRNSQPLEVTPRVTAKTGRQLSNSNKENMPSTINN